LNSYITSAVKNSQKIFFRIRDKLSSFKSVVFRVAYWRLQGMTIGNTRIPRLSITWPHKVLIGSNCILEDSVRFKHDGIWSEGKSILVGDRVFIGRNCEFNIRSKITIGDDSLIASGCVFVDHDHGFDDLLIPMNKQAGEEGEIVIGKDAWIGANCVVLKGVRVGRGSIVAAGAVVAHSVPPFEIWGGIPAKKIGARR
jgi:acetyltransferase-like isoleucine patch superfamily enzyme